MTTYLEDLVDRLGEIKAQIADLADEEKAIKQELIESGESSLDGHWFHASIGHVVKTVTNWRGIVEYLDPPATLIRKHSRSTEYDVVRVGARRAA